MKDIIRDSICKNDTKIIDKKIISTSQVRHLCKCHSTTVLISSEAKALRPTDAYVKWHSVDTNTSPTIDIYVERHKNTLQYWRRKKREGDRIR